MAPPMAPSIVSDQDSASENSGNEDQDLIKSEEPKKKEKRGIIFLSTIPKFMNVAKVREIFGEYGEVDRIFLQPDEQDGARKRKKKPAKHFTEGWIEFKKKRVAKMVAAHLNNKQIGGRKRSKFYDFIWNIKYLSKFKWTHLNERLAYERAVRKQKMHTEIAQAKREANYFSQNVDLSERLSKRRKKGDNQNTASERTAQDGDFVRQYKQRDLDSEIRDKKLSAVASGSVKIKKKRIGHKTKTGPDSNANREDFLKSIFSNRS